MPRIVSLHRWPLKGFAGQKLEKARIEAGKPLHDDRRWAIERSGPAFDPDNPRHVPKGRFLQLVNTARLAALETAYEADSATLTLFRNGRQVARGQLTTAAGRAAIERFLADFLGDDIPAPPRVVGAGDHHFFDVPEPYLSVISIDTIRDISRLTGQDLDPLRFRANIYIEGLPAWEEFGWLEREICVSGARLFFAAERIGRCIATGVNPATAERDAHIPRALLDACGHKDCGLYLRPLADGEIRPGEEIAPCG